MAALVNKAHAAVSKARSLHEAATSEAPLKVTAALNEATEVVGELPRKKKKKVREAPSTIGEELLTECDVTRLEIEPMHIEQFIQLFPESEACKPRIDRLVLLKFAQRLRILN